MITKRVAKYGSLRRQYTAVKEEMGMVGLFRYHFDKLEKKQSMV